MCRKSSADRSAAAAALQWMELGPMMRTSGGRLCGNRRGRPSPGALQAQREELSFYKKKSEVFYYM